MKFVARVIASLFILLSIGIHPSAAVDTATLISQTPFWTERGQSVEFVIESASPLQDVSIHISETPLIGRSSLDSYVDDSLNVSFREIRNFALLNESNQIKITLNQVSLSASGVYVVEIRASNTPLLKTLLSYSNNIDINPLNTVILWSITAPPSQNPLNESLVEDFWQNNRGLVEAVTPHPLDDTISWIVDSDVISLATNNENQEWIDAIKAATTNSDIYVSPFANTDVNALVKARKMRLAEAAISSVLPVTSVIEKANIPRVIIGKSFSPRTWDWIEKEGIYLSVTSSQQYPSTTSVFTPSGVVANPNDKKSLVVDRRTSQFMSSALKTNSARDLQVLQADLFITALEQPQSNRTIVLNPTLWNSQPGSKVSVLDVFTSPWLKPRKASEAIRGDVTDQRALRNVETSQLTKTQRNLINNLETYRKRLSPFIANSIHDVQSIHASLRVASIFTKNRQLIQDATQDYFENLLDAVSIVSSGSVVFANESGIIPLTIRNDLSVGVYVNVLAKGFPEVRVKLGNVDFVEIGAGQRKSIDIPATLYGSENAFVDLQLVDALGKKIGEPRRIEIASSAYSTIAGVFVSVAFGLLFLLLIYNTQKRIRASRLSTLENSPHE